jgi:hypothetical protein
MINFLLFFIMAIEAVAATSPATQPTDTISLYHAIVTADDDGVLVQGIAEVLPDKVNHPINLKFESAADLQAQATPDTATIKIIDGAIEVRPASVDEPVKVEFQYFRPWPKDGKSPLTIELPSAVSIDTVMISLPIRGLKFETEGLKKTHLESQEVYTAFDLSPENEVLVQIYPPKTWWGQWATDFVILACTIIVVISFLLKLRRCRHG